MFSGVPTVPLFVFSAHQIIRHQGNLCKKFVSPLAVWVGSNFPLFWGGGAGGYLPWNNFRNFFFQFTKCCKEDIESLRILKVLCVSSPKEEITIYIFWECSNIDFIIIIVMGQSKMPITKGKKLTLYLVVRTPRGQFCYYMYIILETKARGS
jgi:hypothetical protein